MRDKKIKYPKPKSVTLDIQKYNIEQSFPEFKFFKNNKESYWIGKIQPTESSSIYTIKIIYKYKKSPKVFVKKPTILQNSPHVYSDGSLCLYYPYDKNYNNKQSIIADTIIPWTAEWLYFYEIWLETGIWWGREAPHKDETIDKMDKMEEFA